MVGDWPRVKISEVCDLIVDCVKKTAPKVEGPTPFKMLRTTNVRNGRIDTSNCKFVTEEVYEKWTRRAKVLPGDVILTGEAPMGEVGRVSEDDTIFLGQRLMQYRANPKLLDSRYLLYAVRSADLQHQFFVHEGSGSVVSHIRVPDCSKFIVPLPSLEEQQSFAGILGTLDDRIELNRKTNETLEAMAQALFKSWFVDFDLVIDNALAVSNDIPEPFKACAAARQALGDARKPLPEKIRREFPDGVEFRDEMGWVPRGWESATVSSVTDHVRVTVASQDILPDDFYVGLEHIDKHSLFLQSAGLGESDTSNKSRFQEHDVLFGKLRPYFHKVCIASRVGICSSDILVFRTKAANSRVFMTLTLFSDKLVEFADLRSTGTRMPRANAKDILAYPIVLPSKPVLKAFEKKLTPALGRGLLAVKSNLVLNGLRDTLLPKLLSGQLTIPNAEKIISNAT